MDFTELIFTYQVQPHPSSTLDLQLVDITNRPESSEKQQNRLFRLFPGWVIHRRNQKPIAKIHLLNGLQSCLEEHKLKFEEGKKEKVDHSRWLERPLPAEYWDYAAKDVLIIHHLYQAFISKGFMRKKNKYRAPSHRYITIWADVGKKQKGDVYRSHPILAMDILNPTGPNTLKCSVGCQRQMNRQNLHEQGRDVCVVCWILQFKKVKR